MPQPMTLLFAAVSLLSPGFAASAGDQQKHGPTSAADREIDFARDIQPILAANCYDCHGPNAQQARLRLDAKRVVFAGGISGPAIVPGKSADSLLVKRIAGIGNIERMPKDGKPLSKGEIALIRTWIDQGAVWPDGIGPDVTPAQQHWAYVKPIRPEVPAIPNAGFSATPGFSPEEWVRNPIDSFVLDRLRQEGLRPSPEADKARLLRRVYLDLTGLPPSPEEIDAFLNDVRPDAYEQVVKRLLASPRYGEKWARSWLDLARYSDSNGYQADQYRDVWPYRDWVIRAMNADMPFDQFTIEQIAGDLLPNATEAQKIATGFHRQTPCNVEAGVDPEENRVNQIIDRVNTTGMVWLGTSIECGQCHEHKYDPFTQRDYYRLFAFFNNTPMEVKHAGGTTYNFYGPKMELPYTEAQRMELDRLKQKRAALQKKLGPKRKTVDQEFEQWEQSQLALVRETSAASRRRKPTGSNPEADSSGLQGTNPEASASPLPEAIAKILKKDAAKRSNKEKKKLRNHYLQQHYPQVKQLEERLAAVNKQIGSINPPTTLVMVEKDEPRTTHIFKRGNFLTPGRHVQPGTPAALHDAANDWPKNRLGLARWLVSKENPLVARVTVNRWWAEVFGQGIVRTEEDFGTQGDPPTHPKLLDWLAVEFMDSGWSMKHVHELIVTSATYRQSSRVTPELLKRDPENKLLARGPRFRMPAEMIRDQALAVSGLLATKMGGPPVYPPQPPGIWRHVGRNAPKYKTSTGRDRFRRGIYTVWRRSAPYPAFVNFDAPDRAACTVQRPRTNTPLQALTLMNDQAYVEMARALAVRIASHQASRRRKPTGSTAQADASGAQGNPEADASGSPASLSVRVRIDYSFRLCMARSPSSDERDYLQSVYLSELARFRKNPKEARMLLSDMPVPAPESISPEELAAWFYVSNILLNLDETITKG